jgi:hypothetical protein
MICFEIFLSKQVGAHDQKQRGKEDEKSQDLGLTRLRPKSTCITAEDVGKQDQYKK